MGKTGGRETSDVWFEAFGKDANIQQIKANIRNPCIHCNTVFYHAKKVMKVQAHLKKCVPYKNKLIDRMNNVLPKFRQQERIVERKQKSIDESLTIVRQTKFEELMAFHYYVTGTPFQHADCPVLAEALSITGMKMPSRKKLSGALLDATYSRITANVKTKFNPQFSMSTLSTDGSTDVNGRSITNYTSVVAGKTIFEETCYDGLERKTAQHVLEGWERVMLKLSYNVVGGTFDNTTTNKKAMELLRVKYKDKFFQGCTSHAWHLFVKRVFYKPLKNMSEVQEGHEEEADDDDDVLDASFPFASLAKLISSLKEVVKFFDKHMLEKEELLDKFESAGGSHPWLVMPGETRWCSITGMLTSFQKSSSILFSHVNSREWTKATSAAGRLKREFIKTVISAPDFDDNIQLCLHILQPVDEIIVAAQSDDLPLSRVYFLCDSLGSKLTAIDRLSQSQRIYLQKLWTHYWNFLYHDATGIAYLLDPKYFGEKVKLADVDLLISYIAEWGQDEDRPGLLDYKTQVTEFIVWARRQREVGRDTYPHPRLWWEAYGGNYPLLRPIALAVFNMAAGSSSTERSFSANNFIHSKLRNRLSEERVNKLTYIKMNREHYKLDENFTFLNECTDEDDSTH